ncbi:MAG: 1,2-phenylacetyl-CoA epoxidase subunit PaaD [Streptosporangiaceae bacterium]
MVTMPTLRQHARADVDRLRERVAAVPDPELPMLTVGDLGILRALDADDHGRVEVTITPTYSGCPALDAIRADIERVVREAGCHEVTVRTVLSPPWTTEWISADGRRKLAEHGIAPPGPAGAHGSRTYVELTVRCPRCGSPETRVVSRFGSTACKAIRVCGACREPFDHVKPL